MKERLEPTQRFSHKVENYIKYRPDYSFEVIDFFEKKLQGTSSHIIADIGSGTGILTALFLKNKNTVLAVEPNEPMRKAAEQLLISYLNFISIDGTAEDTTLSNDSVDFIVAGQAFHWFDKEKFRKECLRILKPNGKVLLLWNTRDNVKTEFMKSYFEFLKSYASDFKRVIQHRIDLSHFDSFFGKNKYEIIHFEKAQTFNEEALIGRYLSASYAFDKDHPKHEEAMNTLKYIFQQHQKGGKVKMWYKTEMYCGGI